MKASELYTKTIEGYKQEISVSPITLHDYCKTHHVNYKGIQLWMSRNSITVAQLKRGVTVHSDSPSDYPPDSVHPALSKAPQYGSGSPLSGV